MSPIDLPPDATAAPQQTVVEFADNRLMIGLCGPHDRYLVQIEQALELSLLRRGNVIAVQGEEGARARGAETLNALYERLEQGKVIEPGDVDAAIRMGRAEADTGVRTGDQLEMFKSGPVEIRTRKKTVEPRTDPQKHYVRQLFAHELVFGLGPAGTGKTYLAVAAAVNMFIEGRVDRIILSRPAVEAGERLGFLPGDAKEKVDPFMQPLYDALHDFLPGKQVTKLIEDKRIEIAPLAFMRGRTLSNAFVVLDEGQNTTAMQMKMFLTRLGEGSRMAITGDMSQIDLPRGVTSGLVQAVRYLKGVKGIGMTRFTASDVVRHPLVARIIEAYDAHDRRDPEGRNAD